MKKQLIILAAIAALSACATDYTKTDPVCSSIADRFLEANENVKHLSIHEYAIVDSVSIGEELTNKINIFKYKNKKAVSKYEFYKEAGKPANAAKWNAEVRKSARILEALDSLGEAYGPSLSSTLYYCVQFDGYARMYKGGGKNLRAWWATVSTDGTARNVQSDENNLRAAMGDLLPGYALILKSAGADEDTED